MQNAPHKFSFEGRSVEYFGFWIINALLRTITLGIYYPWAKTNLRKFFYSNTKFEGSSFTYHGKGIELFVGFLKALSILLLMLFCGGAIMAASVYISSYPIQSLPFLLVSLRVIWIMFITVTPFVLLPIALHGSVKYLLQRVSWRGIYFKYNGRLKDLIFLYIKYGFLLFMGFTIFWGVSESASDQKITIITPALFFYLAAIFYTIFFVETRGYLFNNVTWGNVEVRWYGDGVTFFMLRLRFLFPILMFIFYVHFISQNIRNQVDINDPSFWIIKIALICLFFIFITLFGYIWYLHGYLHFVFSNFRLFQGNTECEVWHESNFGDTLKTWFIVLGISFGAFIFISIIYAIIIFNVIGLGNLQQNLSEGFAHQNLVLMAVAQFFITGIVTAVVVPFIIMFLMRWIINGIRIDHNLDIDHLSQSELDKSGGLGDTLSDLFNIDLV